MSITEQSLYPYIGRVFEEFGWRMPPEILVEGRKVDLLLEREGVKVAVEVKIDTEAKLTEAIADAYAKARSLSTEYAMALLFPRKIREISPDLLDKLVPSIEVTYISLTDWLADYKTRPLRDFARVFTSAYQDWLIKGIRQISYDVIVETARRTVIDVSRRLKTLLLAKEEVIDIAKAVIGRFEVYRQLVMDYRKASEDEIKHYLADITSYILVCQLLFYHKISEELGLPKLPNINPLNPPSNLLLTIDNLFDRVRNKYPKIFGLNPLPVLIEADDPQILYAVARFISALRALRAQHMREDLYGKIYQETIPPETRKNLGAFFTRPVAAEILASLAVHKWDAKIIDPACGSGTLLVKTYQRKLQLAPKDLMSVDRLHERFINDIYGIDIMQFAVNIASINLASQNIKMPIEPNIYLGDAIRKIIESVDANDPSSASLARWLKTVTIERLPTDFDIVIMNPPFTRKEYMKEMLGDKEMRWLRNVIPEVKGKTGYWGYFLVASDKILNPSDATIAAVLPEPFFSGSDAESLREYVLNRGYRLQFVVKSVAEPAFSEQAKYRDYLVVMRRGPNALDKCTIVFLKKPLEEIKDRTDSIISRILAAHDGEVNIETQDFDATTIEGISSLLNRYIESWRPIYGPYTIKGLSLIFELLKRLRNLPLLRDLPCLKIWQYVPGQFKVKASTRRARELFISRYLSRATTAIFNLESISAQGIRVKCSSARTSFLLPLNAIIPALRTPSGVRHMNISGETEYAIISIDAPDLRNTLQRLGRLPLKRVIDAANDIKMAHEKRGCHVVLSHSIQLDSPYVYWQAFYADEKMIAPDTMYNLLGADKTYGKILTLYFNSVVSLIQLLAFTREIRGAYVGHRAYTWELIHVPNIQEIGPDTLKRLLNLFEEVGKKDVPCLIERLRTHNTWQRKIDELSLELVGLNDWISRLDDIYNTLCKELELMGQAMGR